MKSYQKLIAELEKLVAVDAESTVHFIITTKGPFTAGTLGALRRRGYRITRAIDGGFHLGLRANPIKGTI